MFLCRLTLLLGVSGGGNAFIRNKSLRIALRSQLVIKKTNQSTITYAQGRRMEMRACTRELFPRSSKSSAKSSRISCLISDANELPTNPSVRTLIPGKKGKDCPAFEKVSDVGERITLTENSHGESRAKKADYKESNLLLDIGPLIEGTVVKRPSSTVKSPYVADVRLRYGINNGGIEEDSIDDVLAHAPALDVGGLCAPGETVYMSKRPPNSGKTSHVIELAVCRGPECGENGMVMVGAHPRLAERIAEEVLMRGLLSKTIGFSAATKVAKSKKPSSSEKKKKRIKNSEKDSIEAENDIHSKENKTIHLPSCESGPCTPIASKGNLLRGQTTYGDSRIDFELTIDKSPDNIVSYPGKQKALIEVKNVVCADYCLPYAPKKKGKNHCVVTVDKPLEEYKRTAIFPWGRASQTFEGSKVVSERAIKHVRNLADFAQKDPTIQPIVLFVVNRSDCEAMRACHEACPTFARELKDAEEKGVKIVAIGVRWDKDGRAFFNGEIPFHH